MESQYSKTLCKTIHGACNLATDRPAAACEATRLEAQDSRASELGSGHSRTVWCAAGRWKNAFAKRSKDEHSFIRGPRRGHLAPAVWSLTNGSNAAPEPASTLLIEYAGKGKTSRQRQHQPSKHSPMHSYRTMTHNRKSPMGRGGEPNLRGVRLPPPFSAGAFASAAAAAAASSAEYEKICDPEQGRRSGVGQCACARAGATLDACVARQATSSAPASRTCCPRRQPPAGRRSRVHCWPSLAEATFLEAERVDAVALTLFWVGAA